MRNTLSPHGTPSQHNSTLAISPYITNRSSRIIAQHPRSAQKTNDSDANIFNGSANRSMGIPFHQLNTSPLGQKTTKNMASSTIATPQQTRINNNATINGNNIRNQSDNLNVNNSANNTTFYNNTSNDTNLNPIDNDNNSNSNNHNNIANNNNPNSSMLLQSVSKNGIFGYTMPATLKKANLQKEYKDATNIIAEPQNNHAMNNFVSADNHNNNNNINEIVTTTLTTNTTSAATTNDIDISDLSSIEKFRLWRHDALMQHMYTTAEYVGDKIYSITNDPNDAFWLAQVYYNKGDYPRAINLLSNENLVSISIMCRYLMASCLVKLNKFEEALDIIGESNPFADELPQDGKQQQSDGGIKLESSLCFLRGKIYSALNNFSKAKEAFKEAVQVDVKNFEAFEILTNSYLLTPQEEWELIEQLDFSTLDDNETIIKNLYTLRLSKLINSEKITSSQNVLTEEYNLGNNVDIVCSFIDTLYSQCKFSECLDLCEKHLEKDPFNQKILPTYILCLFELHAKNKLFLLSHKLAEKFPKNHITWFSVATYYMSTDKLMEARKFFSKSSILEPMFAPSWLGFAHTYALEGEHDQALSAYSTAARFFPGSHLPYLFLAMQYMSSNTLSLAEEYFTLSYDICPNDPLLLNEMGVMYYKQKDYEKSKRYLTRAMDEVKDLDPTSRTAISIQVNLGHTYKRLGEFERSIKCFKYILEDSEKDSDIFCTLGYLYLRIKQLQKSIDYLHKSLEIRPNNLAAQDLLTHALKLNCSLSMNSDLNVQSDENYLKNYGKNDIGNNKSNIAATNKNKRIGEEMINSIRKKRLQKNILPHLDIVTGPHENISKNLTDSTHPMLQSKINDSDEMMDLE